VVLRFSEPDLKPRGLLSAYLHDAYCNWDEVRFDPAERRLSIQVNRPCHEAPERGRLLGFIPITHFRVVSAVLTVSRVRKVITTTARRRPRAMYTVDSVSCDGDTLVFQFEGARIEAQLESCAHVELRDVGSASPKAQVHHVGRRTVFDVLAHEIELRRADA
jgi:hypothetical protein